jgi:glycerol-3-phosphate dehydrogenase
VKERQDSLQEAKTRRFDLAVIGAGITGAAIAQTASARGLSVILLEKADFASGFSGKTSQIVSCELPCLQELRLKHARRRCEDRERLKKCAPHLIKEVSFVLPLLRNNTLFNLKAAIGSTLHDLMSMLQGRTDKHAFLDTKRLGNLSPALSSSLVSGGIQFQGAITDDARLVLALTKSASQNGAIVLNYVQACGFQLENGSINAVDCHDRYSGKEFRISCRFCLNASGIWTDSVLKGLASGSRPQILPLKSTQIVVPASAFETNCALILPGKEGEFVSVLPWQHALLIGAAETPYSGDADQPRSAQKEIDYLLSVLNSYMEHQHINTSDVKASFAGIRAKICPAADKPGDTSFSEHTIIESEGGLLSVVGSMLSNCQTIAAELMEKLALKDPPLTMTPAGRAQSMLGGWKNKEEFPQRSSTIEIKARRLSIDPASIRHLIESYGAEAEHIVNLVESEPSLNQRIIPDFPVIMAEIPFSATGEMTVSLQDFFFRRTRLALLNHKLVLEASPRVADLLGRTLGWDSYRTKIEISALEQEMFERDEEADPVGT